MVRSYRSYAVLAQAVTGYFGQLTFIPLLVMITEVCSSGTVGASYGVCVRSAACTAAGATPLTGADVAAIATKTRCDD